MKAMNNAKDISVVVTTYNNPGFLELVLQALERQRVLPGEVIVADDGSGEETRLLIERHKKLIPVPLVHSWIPDEGFRVAKSRNIAVAKASGSYIILLDGDIVVTPDFVADHLRLMQPGRLVTGSRARLGEKATRRHVAEKNAHMTFWTRGLGRRFVMLHAPWLNGLFSHRDVLRRARSCHMAFFRDDFLAVNGFEEKFVGWGYEDSEFVQRLFNHGLHRWNAKLMASAVHLYHKSSPTNRSEENMALLQQTINEHRKRAELGVDQYL